MCLILAGTNADGSIKVRPVDNMTASLINDAVEVREKLSYDTLDFLWEILRQLTAYNQVPHSCTQPQAAKGPVRVHRRTT